MFIVPLILVCLLIIVVSLILLSKYHYKLEFLTKTLDILTEASKTTTQDEDS